MTNVANTAPTRFCSSNFQSLFHGRLLISIGKNLLIEHEKPSVQCLNQNTLHHFTIVKRYFCLKFCIEVETGEERKSEIHMQNSSENKILNAYVRLTQMAALLQKSGVTIYIYIDIKRKKKQEIILTRRE